MSLKGISNDMPFSMKDMFAGFADLRESEPIKSKTLPSPENIRKKDEIDKSKIDLFKCSYCQESTVCEEDGIIVCTTCGRENGNVITGKQEWRNHVDSGKDDPSRCGMPVHPLLPNSSLGTIAQGYGRGGIQRLQLQNAMPSSERSLLDAIKIIKEASQILSIPATLADKACYLYAQLTKNLKIKRGPVRRGLMANCQNAICKRKESSCYVCVEKMVKAYNIDMKKYNEGAKLFVQLTYHKTYGNTDKKWGKDFSSSRKAFVKPTDPENIAEDACKKLGFDDNQIAEVTYIIRQVNRLKIVSSRMPQSIAAGCLILYVREKKLKKVTVSNISKICVVSDATAKNTYNDLKIGKKFLFPKNQSDLYSSKVGNCMPKVRLENIYTAPKRALPKAVILPSVIKEVESNRGRPRLNNDINLKGK
jgi:transcription initiation factor TFIIIB Brf1 subunit/transcription initiation factor TFIIB